MNVKRYLHQLTGWCVFMLIASLWLASCAYYPSSFAYPAPATTSAPATLLQLYPTLPGGTPFDSVRVSVFATPSPDEQFGLAEVREAPAEAGVPRRYIVESEPIEGKPSHWRALYLRDSTTATRIRLGDDSGHAIEAVSNQQFVMNDDYLVWFFLCDPCLKTPRGIYAHSFATGKEIFIGEKFSSYQDATKIAGDWVSYIQITSKYTADLYIHNLKSGEQTLVTKEVFNYLAWNDFFSAVNEGKIAWVALDSATNGIKRSL